MLEPRARADAKLRLTSTNGIHRGTCLPSGTRCPRLREQVRTTRPRGSTWLPTRDQTIVEFEATILVGHFSKKTGYPSSAVTYVPQALDGWRPESPAELRQRPRSAAVVSITFTGSQFLVLLVYGDMDYTP